MGAEMECCDQFESELQKYLQKRNENNWNTTNLIYKQRLKHLGIIIWGKGMVTDGHVIPNYKSVKGCCREEENNLVSDWKKKKKKVVFIPKIKMCVLF